MSPEHGKDFNVENNFLETNVRFSGITNKQQLFFFVFFLKKKGFDRLKSSGGRFILEQCKKITVGEHIRDFLNPFYALEPHSELTDSQNSPLSFPPSSPQQRYIHFVQEKTTFPFITMRFVDLS